MALVEASVLLPVRESPFLQAHVVRPLLVLACVLLVVRESGTRESVKANLFGMLKVVACVKALRSRLA